MKFQKIYISPKITRKKLKVSEKKYHDRRRGTGKKDTYKIYKLRSRPQILGSRARRRRLGSCNRCHRCWRVTGAGNFLLRRQLDVSSRPRTLTQRVRSWPTMVLAAFLDFFSPAGGSEGPVCGGGCFPKTNHISHLLYATIRWEPRSHLSSVRAAGLRLERSRQQQSFGSFCFSVQSSRI